MLLIIFFLVTISSIKCANKDQFTFDIEIVCKLTNKPTFWYSVQFLEKDKFSLGEWITKKYEETLAFGRYDRIFKGEMDGDEIWSEGYDAAAIFEHDCMENKKKTKARFNFLRICKMGKPCYLGAVIDLTNKSGEHSLMTIMRQRGNF